MKQTKFRNTVNLAETKFGSKIIFKTDQFFGAAERILSSEKPIFKEGVYDSHGKWMDGWETRRKRKAGHDYLIIKLGRPGKINNVDQNMQKLQLLLSEQHANDAQGHP